jgi:aspartate/methionine/tyrosine aminotransferase
LNCRLNAFEITYINNIISDYQRASGQLVNINKSEIMFSKHVKDEAKRSIHQILPMNQVEFFSRYLGMPTVIGRSKNQTFQFIQDKVWKKLKGWKEKHLSFAGRAALIRAVAQAISHIYHEQFFTPKKPL